MLCRILRGYPRPERIMSNSFAGHIGETYSISTELTQISQCLLIIARVLDLDLQIILMTFILLRKVGCMLKVPSLPAHADGGIQIEWQLVSLSVRRGPPRLGLDEAVEPCDVFELRVRVQEERRVIGVGQSAVVQFLEVRDEVVDPLRVQELRIHEYVWYAFDVYAHVPCG